MRPVYPETRDVPLKRAVKASLPISDNRLYHMEQVPDSTQTNAPQSPQAPRPLGPSPEVRVVLYRAFTLGLVIVLGVLILIIAIVNIGSGLLTALAAGTPPAAAPSVPVAIPAVSPEVSLPPTTEPVELLPANLAVAVSVESKNSAGAVTVNFLGGAGRAQVKEIQARLSRSDGTVVTGTMDLTAEFPQTVLQGTKETDRIEVFARMLSGKTYKILDQNVPYPRRN